MKITSVSIDVVPAERMHYPTVGDWFFNDGKLIILVADQGNWVYNMAIGLHEFIEALLCTFAGISEQEITDYDKRFEKERGKDNDEEPGDQTDSPYWLPHAFATSIERLFISACSKNWKEYEDHVDAIFNNKLRKK